MGGNGGEAVVMCGDKSMGSGITVWDIDTGDRLLHIPSCASPAKSLLCLRSRFIVASQIHRPGSIAGGVICMWPLNKPQQPLWSYPLESIVSLACTKDGVYLAGGAPSGNAYLWQVNSGKLLKTWHAHYDSMNCMLFHDDGSLLISGSDDGAICLWSLISLLDVEDYQSTCPLLSYSMDHKSSITGLSISSGSSRSVIVSSSLDGSCKVWDLGLGTLLHTQVYPLSITALILDPTEQLFFSGSIDGRIFMNQLKIGLVDEDDPLFTVEKQAVALKGHNGSVTALTFCQSGLISGSEDCTICIWDVTTWAIIRRFDHQKGGTLTNLAVIPRSSLLPGSNQRRGFSVPLLEKYPQTPNSSRGDMSITLVSSCEYQKENQSSINFQTTGQHIYNMEKECTPASMEMKLEQSLAERSWATKMAKHVMDMNRHLQSRLLDMMQSGLVLSRSTEMGSPSTKKRETPMSGTRSPPVQEMEQP